MNRMKENGFTLMETVVVLVVMGLLASIAQASFREMAARSRLNSAIDMIGTDFRKARYESIMSGEHYRIDFEPAAGSYLINGKDRVSLPGGIRFGADPGVTGKPNQPGDRPPADGVTFLGDGVQNRVEFFPRGMIIPTGAVYVTDGKETRAITVYLNGHVRTWRSGGGNKWTLL